MKIGYFHFKTELPFYIICFYMRDAISLPLFILLENLEHSQKPLNLSEARNSNASETET